VCDNAKQSCPAFIGNSDSIIHKSFQDPANEKGSEDKILNEFRNVRDLIKVWVNSL
jgi:arsenate reductase